MAPTPRTDSTPRLRLHVSALAHLSLNAARTALANAVFRARYGGQLMLVLDDSRSADMAEGIVRDLGWIGVTADEVMRRGERAVVHETHIAALRNAGRLYPCFESDAELKVKSDRRRRQGKPDIYDREMLSLTRDQRARAEASGKRPHWRFCLSDGEARWRDATLGSRLVAFASLSDPVLVRADGVVAPALARAIDDRDLGVTHLIGTPINAAEMATHLDLMLALNARVPTIVTLSSLDDAAAGLGGRALRRLRADGVMAAAATDWLRQDEVQDLDALLARNREALRAAPFAAVAEHLPRGATEMFWLGVRDGLSLVTDATPWWRAMTEAPHTTADQSLRPALHEALALLPDSDDALADWAPPPALRAVLIGDIDDTPPPGFWRLLGRARIVDRLGLALGTR